MLRSLRARLFLGLMAVIIFTAVGGAWFTYVWAFNEAIESQDSVLLQIGAFAGNAPLAVTGPVKGVDAEAEITLVELGAAPRGHPDDRRLWTLKDGLTNEMRGGQPIRALLRTRADGSRYAVSQRTEVRDEIAQDTALRTLLPIAVLVPCLLVVTALVIAYSFKPMVKLAADLDLRKPDDLRELPFPDAPSELSPYLISINRLLSRLQIMVDQQKRFIADAAHELRTPITALSIQAENLNPLNLPSEARARIMTLQTGMQRTRHLLEQLLDLARQDSGESTAVGSALLDKIAKDVVADLLPEAAARNIDLGFDVVEELAVAGDPTALTSLVRNLVENAVKYTPDGGRIDIGIYREAGAVVFKIEDSGPGIPPGDLDRIVEPFYRGRNSTTEGSGLGLSIVKRAVDRLGGRLTFENLTSSERTGLRVIVRLPYVSA